MTKKKLFSVRAVALPIAALLASTPSLAAQTRSGNQPLLGLWKLDFDKSHIRLPPGFAGYGAGYREYEDEGDGWVFETVTTITPKGTQFLFTAARFDGMPYSDYTAKSLGNFVRYGAKPPQTVTFTRVNAYQIQWTDTVNGRAVSGGTETVSEDGNMLTMTTHVPGQEAIHVQIYDRVSGPSALAPTPGRGPGGGTTPASRGKQAGSGD